MSTDSSRTFIVIDGISYIPSSALLMGVRKISFKDNHAFAVVDPIGESPRLYSPSSELGFYYKDTRYLSTWEMTFNGASPVALADELRFSGNTAVFSMTNRDFPRIDTKTGAPGRIPRDTFLIRRILTLVEDTLYETVEIKNFSDEPHLLQVEQWGGGHFDDIFEVRGYSRPRRGQMLPPSGDDRTTVFQYEGLDGKERRTYVHRLFPTEKIRVSPSLAGHSARVEVPPKGIASLKTIISFDQQTNATFLGIPYATVTIPEKMRILSKSTGESDIFSVLKVESDNVILNRAIQSARTDIHVLLTEEKEEDGKSTVLYPYAGIPWFSAPFGRDGIITAYQLLPWFPKLARGVLDYTLERLGQRVDPFTDEQPGKVFHEMRRGEMANTREVPFIPYYGSVDSTPLCLILLHEYIRWTMDLENLKRWWEPALQCLEWMDRWGDSDGDGFLEYLKQSPTGLANQGWKDSHNSIMHADGKLAEPPIRLCEVQGYTYRAKMGMSVLARLLGKQDLSAKLRLEALQLKALFSGKFWDAAQRYVYLALDGKGNPCAVRTSNMGHCLWSHILSPAQAREVATHLLSPEMFSGHGVRTLADTEVAYNPLSYHNGSVWPHDNSIVMEGLRFYDESERLERLVLGMMGILESSEDFRLPELFCGFRKRGNEPPIPYEVACKPQAWAAGSIFLMIKSMLGISMDADQDYVVFHNPFLVPQVNVLEIKGLQGRDWEVDLLFRRGKQGTHVDVTHKRGAVRILTVK